MNFKIAFVGASLMAFAGIITVGCGSDPCQTAADSIAAKQTSCPDKPAATAAGSTTGAAVTCTDALGKVATCQAACFTGTTCECLGLDKAKMCAAADATKFLDCISKCK
jgi:hypothetical protein